MTQDLGRYLGVPVLHGKTTRNTYQPIFDRLDSKLSGSKANSLSLAGRVTIALSVLNAIPAYAMQTSVLPCHICEAINRKTRNFVWGSTNDCRKIHLVSWDEVCRPKEHGGLGLKKAKELNMAFMMKLAFQFFKSPNELWVQVLQHKYFREGPNGLQIKNDSRLSPLWRAIKKVTQVMRLGMKMGLRDGAETSFWLDRWIDGGDRLIDLVSGSTADIDVHQPVNAFVSATGEWNWPLFDHFLSRDGCLQVAGMSPPMAGSGEDRITWGLERDGRFRVRSAYLLAAEEEGDTLDPIWRLIWRWKGPQRIRQFFWLVAHNRLLTNSERRRRHLAEIGSCQVCPGQEESVLHVLRDCPLASATWELLALSSGDQTFFQTPLLPWIERFIRKPELCLLFGVTCWWLWRARNDRVFNNKLTTAESLTRHIQAWVALVGDTMERDRFISHTGPPTRTGGYFSWEPAPPEWVTLNSDGSVLPETGQASAGGLIRDHQGRCLAAFTMNLGKCSITRAELRGAVSGLQLAWERGYRKIQLQLDSQCAVQLLQGYDLEDHAHETMIIMARELLRRDWEVRILHVYRESNHVTDYLANIGHSCPLGFHSIEQFDPNFCYWLHYDQLGVSEERLIMNER
ncbi:Putative ribonuclease H protein At1g65750 [Linum perenne]